MDHSCFNSGNEAQAAVESLARDQLELYQRQPKELISHANREMAAIEGYRGRQLLELLQNADDRLRHGAYRVVLDGKSYAHPDRWKTDLILN